MLLVSAMNRGGAERVAATLCNAWAARGDEVTLVATYSARGTCEYTLDERVQLVYLADLVRTAGVPRRAAGRTSYVKRLLRLRRLVRETRPDAIISFLTNVNVSAVIATLGLRIPLIVSERIDPVAEADTSWFWKLLRRILYPLADAVTVQTVAGIAALRSCVPAARQIETVPNPLPEELQDAGDVPPPKGTRRRLVAMGRLAGQKQWDHLIAVFASIAPRYPDVDLWIWGEGNLRPALEGQAAAAGLASRVFLPGRTDSPWLEMAAAEIFVLTSAYEGFPNVLLEAMALGLPCVVYDCPSGPRDLSEDGRVAALVPLNDRAALERKIIDLLDDPAARRRLGRFAADSVRSRYRLAAVLERWDEIVASARSRRYEPPARIGFGMTGGPREPEGPAAPVKVVFVITGLGAGGAERMLLKVASRLSGRIKPTVVSLTGRGLLATEFERAGIPVLTLDMRGLPSLAGAIIRLIRHLRAIRPDVVSTWMYHADLVGGLAARLAGIRRVAWNIRNSSLSNDGSGWATRAVVRLNARLSRKLPDTILCCSAVARQIHVDLGYDPSRVTLIPNGFDLNQYKPDPAAAASVRAELAIPPGAPLIGLVARWHPQKNHRGFVEAAAMLHRYVPDAHFVLAGDGCLDSNVDLVQWIERAQLTGAFRLLGVRADVPRLTAAFDLATSSSIFGEAFPNVLGEAMACAVPCVATDVGDSAFIVGDTGRIVTPGRAQELAAAWADLLRMDITARRTLGTAARTRVSDMFELGAVTRRYEEVFLALAAEPHPSTPCAA